MPQSAKASTTAPAPLARKAQLAQRRAQFAGVTITPSPPATA